MSLAPQLDPSHTGATPYVLTAQIRPGLTNSLRQWSLQPASRNPDAGNAADTGLMQAPLRFRSQASLPTDLDAHCRGKMRTVKDTLHWVEQQDVCTTKTISATTKIEHCWRHDTKSSSGNACLTECDQHKGLNGNGWYWLDSIPSWAHGITPKHKSAYMGLFLACNVVDKPAYDVTTCVKQDVNRTTQVDVERFDGQSQIWAGGTGYPVLCEEVESPIPNAANKTVPMMRVRRVGATGNPWDHGLWTGVGERRELDCDQTEFGCLPTAQSDALTGTGCSPYDLMTDGADAAAWEACRAVGMDLSNAACAFARPSADCAIKP